MTENHKFLFQLLTLVLTVSFLLPCPAIALRTEGSGSEKVKSGLEETLLKEKGPANNPNRVALLPTVTLTAPPATSALSPILAGLEEGKDRISQAISEPEARTLAEVAYDATKDKITSRMSLEQNLRGVVQAVASVRKQQPTIPFSWMKVGIKGQRAFVAFEVGQHPVVIRFDRNQIREVMLDQEVPQQLSYTTLLGGQVGPKRFSEEFLRHHPDEPSDFAITLTTGQVLDQLARRNGRVTLVLTKNKRDIAVRFARGWVNRYDGNDPMTFLWIIPSQVDVYFDVSSDPGEELRKRLTQAGMTVKGVFPTPEAVGEAIADETLREWQEKDRQNSQYSFGLVTGTTPKPFLAALMPKLRALPPAIRSGLLHRLTIVVPDDHVERDAAEQYHNITRAHPVSAYTTRESDFIRPANEGLPAELPGMSIDQVMVPEVGQVETQLQKLQGIDRYFLTFGPQHVFMQFAGEAESVRLFDPQELIQQPVGLTGQHRVVVIQNSAEPAGVFGQVPASFGLPVEVVKAYDPVQRHLIPSDAVDWDWQNVAAVIVMGGPPNVYESGTFLWLEDLDRFIQAAVKQQTPYLGVCLGCQLLARAVGGEVTPDSNAPRGVEKGFTPVTITSAGQQHPLFSGLRPRLNIAELHGDTIFFPEGAAFQLADGTQAPISLLAKGERVPWQAFAIGKTAIGVLGHLEASPEVFGEWLKVPENEPDAANIRRMERLYKKNPAYQKRRNLAAENWWKLVEQFWRQRQATAGLEERKILARRLRTLISELNAQLDREQEIGRGRLRPKIEQIQSDALFTAGGVTYLPAREGKLVVVGDLHGDQQALDAIMRQVSGEDFRVYVGDYEDVGSQSLEVVTRVVEDKLRNPEKVILLAGNHDRDQPTASSRNVLEHNVPWFFREITELLGEQEGGELVNEWYLLTQRLPVMMVTPNGIVVGHASPPSLEDPPATYPERFRRKFDPARGLLEVADPLIRDQLAWNLIRRPNPGQKEIEGDMVIDPSRNSRVDPKTMQPGYWIGRKSYFGFLNSIGGKIFVRGHDSEAPTQQTLFDGTLLTVISTDYRSPQHGYPREKQIVARYASFDLGRVYNRVSPSEAVHYLPGWPPAAGMEEYFVDLLKDAGGIKLVSVEENKHFYRTEDDVVMFVTDGENLVIGMGEYPTHSLRIRDERSQGSRVFRLIGREYVEPREIPPIEWMDSQTDVPLIRNVHYKVTASDEAVLTLTVDPRAERIPELQMGVRAGDFPHNKWIFDGTGTPILRDTEQNPPQHKHTTFVTIKLQKPLPTTLTEFTPAAGSEERPKPIPITRDYGKTHAKELTAMDAAEPVWQEEGAWAEQRWSMDVRPSTGTPLQDIFNLSFAVEDPPGKPAAYIYTTNGQPDYPVTQRYPGAFIFRLSVRQDQKGRRLGPLLLLASAHAAKAKGIGPYVTLETDEKNAQANYVYQSLGFKDVGRRKDGKKPDLVFVEYAVPIDELIEKAEAQVAQRYGPQVKSAAGAEETPAQKLQRYQTDLVQQIERDGRFYIDLDEAGFVRTLNLLSTASLGSYSLLRVGITGPRSSWMLPREEFPYRLLAYEKGLGVIVAEGNGGGISLFNTTGERQQLSSGLLNEENQRVLGEKIRELMAALAEARGVRSVQFSKNQEAREEVYRGAIPGTVTFDLADGHRIEIVVQREGWEIKPAAGMEEKGTPTAVGLKALLEYVAREDVIRTIALLAESGKTGDVTGDFPALGGLAKEAGFAEGVVAILQTVAPGEAVLGVPAQYAAQGIPVFVKKEWEDRVRQNLSKLEMAGRIRFVGSADEAFLVIGDDSLSVRPDQAFIAINEDTVSRVTPHLLQELQLSGLLKAGSIVMLYTPLKGSVLVFA